MTYKPGSNLTITLTIIFVVLKLTKLISWSWWWVLSPLWIDLAITLLFLGLMFALTLLVPNTKISIRRNK